MSEKSFLESAFIVAAGVGSCVYLYTCCVRLKHHRAVSPELDGVVPKKDDAPDRNLYKYKPQQSTFDQVDYVYRGPLKSVIAN